MNSEASHVTQPVENGLRGLEATMHPVSLASDKQPLNRCISCVSFKRGPY